MVRIWAKIISDDRIIKNIIYEDFSKFEIEKFFDYVADICSQLDIATPIILSKHIIHFVSFNNAVFSPTDFPEEVTFDRLVLEEASNY